MSDHSYPTRPHVGVLAVVRRGERLLMVQRSKPPRPGVWGFPGGAQELGETAEAAARRELLEETGLTVGPLHLAAHVDSIHRDPEGRIRFHYTILDFAARWQGGDPAAAGDVTDATWAPLDGLEQYVLWSEAHRVIALARRLLG